MSEYTVALDDFRNAARSYAVVGVVGAFTAMVALTFAAEIGLFDDPYRALFDVQLLVTFVFPLLVAPLTYLCIAGERADGRITFPMGLPNSRREYFVGKLLSRFGVAAAAVVVATVVGFAVAATTFANAPDVGRFLAFAAITLLYASAWVGVFVAISAAATKRSRAMVGVVLAYFAFVPFWFGTTGIVSLAGVMGAVADLLGVTLSESATHAVQSLSPAFAYFAGMKPLYAGVVDTYPEIEMNYGGDLPFGQWYYLLVLVAWPAASLALGYLTFRRSELTA